MDRERPAKPLQQQGIHRAEPVDPRASLYPLPFWATYRQYLAAGLQVQKGEHGTGIIYAGRTVKTDTKTDENGEEKESKKQIRFLKAFVVFNVAQTDYKEKGYKLPDLKENPHLLGCDAVIQDYTGRDSIRITEGTGRILPSNGYHHLPGDRPVQNIRALLRYNVPRVHSFNLSPAQPVQSDRSGLLRVRTRYGREELVAEIGSAYLAALTGIDSSAIVQNQAAYLQNWTTAIKADADLVMYAVGRAEKAADFMIGAPEQARNV